MSLSYKAISRITNGDEVLSSYTINIAVNSFYLLSLVMWKFQPSIEIAELMISMIISYYIYDINKLLWSSSTLSEKITYVPHHIVSIILIGGQVYDFYPLSIGMVYLTMFEFSNFFLQFFQLSQKKKWLKLRNIVTCPFALTYIPVRGICIPLYSLKFIPYIRMMNVYLSVIYTLLFIFINGFSMYFSYVVLSKFVSHIQKRTVKGQAK